MVGELFVNGNRKSGVAVGGIASGKWVVASGRRSYKLYVVSRESGVVNGERLIGM